MKSTGRSFFAQRDFYANALFVRARVLDDGVTLHVAAAPFQPFKTAGRMSGDVTLKRADVQQVYRCRRIGLVVLSDASGVPPTMISWWVAQALLADTGHPHVGEPTVVSRASTQRVMRSDAPRAAVPGR